MNIINNMYGMNKIKDETVTNKPPAYQSLAGLKITGSQKVTLDVDGKIVDVSTATYTKLLENQISELRKDLRITQSENIKLKNKINSVVNELNKIYTLLNNKVNIR